MTTDEEIFHGFVFDGKHYAKEKVEQATRAMQRSLTSTELRRVNDALLARLANAKEARRVMPKKEQLNDPDINTLVNTLVLVNQAWITHVIEQNVQSRPHLSSSSVGELYSTALTGRAGTVGGVMNAILKYDYAKRGVDAFTPYLTAAIRNALQQTPKEHKTYQRIYAGMQSMHGRDDDARGKGWVDRTVPRPEAAAINRELLEVVQSVIPRLPTAQQRDTAAWLFDRILATGELPMTREVAQRQQPPVSGERGRQIMEETVDSIRRQIEADYPQLAAEGINGWVEFKKAFTRTNLNTRRADPGNDRA